MRALLLLPMLFAVPAGAQTYNPTARYVTAGQDSEGYRSWYLASPAHPIRIAGLHHYLTTYGAGWIVPTWQIVRTASDWRDCEAAPFEVPPTSEWPNIVQTLRFVRDEVIPQVGPVEAVSAYRNPVLNACAGGSPGSAHLNYFALDLVPLNETTREELARTLCALHERRGPAYGAGLGFYSFLRFHVDSKGFRRWVPAEEGFPCQAIESEPQPSATAETKP